MQVRRSLKIRGRRKEKEKLPSGITADYSANFFAHLDLDRDVERDRGVEEVLADGNATIDNNGDSSSDHVLSINVSHSDSSETSMQSIGNANKVIFFFEISTASIRSMFFSLLFSSSLVLKRMQTNDEWIFSQLISTMNEIGL